MRTVKQVSEMTGISVRALHYYDQIGLLRPTVCNEAGYRFYDDKALEILRRSWETERWEVWWIWSLSLR